MGSGAALQGSGPLAGIAGGSNVCIDGTTNDAGDLLDFTATPNKATSSISVCGLFSALDPGTGTQPPRLVIGGTTYTLIGSGTITPPDISARGGRFTHALVPLPGSADGAPVPTNQVTQAEA